MKFFNTITTEMWLGNFSFLILVVGIMQWREMRKNKQSGKSKKHFKLTIERDVD
jgi:hypothetical protein